MTVPTEHLLILAGILFSIGVAGFCLRRNLIVVLMSIELMLNAANLTFIAGSRLHSTVLLPALEGALFALFVIVVAAAEAAVGLALVIALYRRKQTVSVDSLDELGLDDRGRVTP
jgi:NADH-quinone oxidoreductase subunit K